MSKPKNPIIPIVLGELGSAGLDVSNLVSRGKWKNSKSGAMRFVVGGHCIGRVQRLPYQGCCVWFGPKSTHKEPPHITHIPGFGQAMEIVKSAARSRPDIFLRDGASIWSRRKSKGTLWH